MHIKFENIKVEFSGDAETAREVMQTVGRILAGALAPAMHVPATLDTTEEELPALNEAQQEAADDAFPVRLPTKRATAKPRKNAPRKNVKPARPARLTEETELSPQEELAQKICDTIRLDGPQSVPQLAVRFQVHSIAIGKCVAKYYDMLTKGEDGLVQVVD